LREDVRIAKIVIPGGGGRKNQAKSLWELYGESVRGGLNQTLNVTGERKRGSVTCQFKEGRSTPGKRGEAQ